MRSSIPVPRRSAYRRISIAQLGLYPVEVRRGHTAAGVRSVTLYSDVRLTILERDTVVRVIGLPAGSPSVVGQIPLEDLDLILIPSENKIAHNPANGGEWSIDLFFD